MPRGHYDRTKFKKNKKRGFVVPSDNAPVPTVTLGEALAHGETLTTKGSMTITTNITPGLLTVKMRCEACGHEETKHIPSGSEITCPLCFDKFIHKNVPKMREIPPAELPPGPPAPKPKLAGLKRYAKVIFEPINPRFCTIKFEDDGTEARLWKDRRVLTYRHVQLVVEPNRDEGMGGWTIVREMPATL